MIRPEWQEGIRRMVDGWPPVSETDYARLALLLAPEPSAAVRPMPPRAQPAHQTAA